MPKNAHEIPDKETLFGRPDELDLPLSGDNLTENWKCILPERQKIGRRDNELLSIRESERL